jgi:homoserine kinase
VQDLVAGRSVSVRVPASTANLGPGFDSVGLALGIWDECTATVAGDRLDIVVEGEGAGGLPCDEGHLVHRSMVRAWQEQGVRPPAGLRLRCRNTISHNRGLGSSAAAFVAGVALAHGLVSAGCRPEVEGGGDDIAADLVVDLAAVNDLASELEGHPDNASASVFGGLTLSWSDDAATTRRTRTVRLAVHPDIVPVVLVPTAELATARARAVLPTSVPLADAARNSARAALLVEAMTRRPDLLLPATRDWLHQESRRESYAASMALVDTLRSQGHAATVSGAGPGVVVLATKESVTAVSSAVTSAVTLGGARAAWRILVPGVPDSGVTARLLHG